MNAERISAPWSIGADVLRGQIIKACLLRRTEPAARVLRISRDADGESPSECRRASCKQVAISPDRRRQAMTRWTKALSRPEWLRLSAFGGCVLFLHLLGWGLFLY